MTTIDLFLFQDGPSAGVTIATTLVSLLTGRLVRTDLVGQTSCLLTSDNPGNDR